MVNPPEGFLTIPNYPRYAVNEVGVVMTSSKRGGAWDGIWRIRSPSLQEGYQVVGLWVSGKQKLVRVHRLVLTVFRGECPEGMECRHLNGIRNDNRLENLAWGTRKENAEDRIRHGTGQRGERLWSVKLTEVQVIEIRRRYCLGGITQKELAIEFNVTSPSISHIITRRSWSHV